MAAQTTEPLLHGYHLGDYVIDRRIGGGGFSLVYLAFDMDGQPVAIKEYLPGGVVRRGDQGTVHPVSVDKESSFRYGMKCFFEEGRSLAGIRHPNVVKVVNFFRANGSPVLIDFGAARHALSQDFMQSPMYTPGFAAPEQYKNRDRLGPWTDIYSVGATMYACMTKAPPPPADERQEKEKLTPLIKSHSNLYSKDLLELVDNMLLLEYTARPQSVFSIQKQLINMAQVARLQEPSLFALIKERLTRDL